MNFWRKHKKIKHAHIDHIQLCQFPFPSTGGYYEVMDSEDCDCEHCLEIIRVYNQASIA